MFSSRFPFSVLRPRIRTFGQIFFHQASSQKKLRKPQRALLGTHVFELLECRHPVLENAPFAASFIPNDIKCG